MTYDEKTAARVKKIVGRWKGISSRGMFGGVCYLLNGHMFCGIYQEYLILRLGVKGAAEALRSSLVRPLDITGRPMKGWIMVSPGGFAEDEMLSAWLLEAKQFIATLPEK